MLRSKVNVDQKVWSLVDLLDCERQKYLTVMFQTTMGWDIQLWIYIILKRT